MLSVIIPCFNERPNIERFGEELLPPLQALGLPYEVVAVDDGSSDGTSEALRELSERLPLRLIRHPENLGLGAALRTGFAKAQGDWIVTLDADLSFHPSQIQALLEKQRQAGADLVSGSPFLRPPGGSGVPWTRRLPSLLVNAFYRGFLDPRLTAYTPIFRLYRAASLKALPLKSTGFEINAEIAARFVLARHKTAEAPVVLGPRLAGRSKLRRVRELVRHCRLILRLLAGGES